MSALNRRALLLGAVAAPAALVFPSGAEAAVQKFDLQGWLDGQTAKSRANWHMGRLADAMWEINPGYWLTIPNTGHDDAFVVIQRCPNRSKSMSGVQTNFIL